MQLTGPMIRSIAACAALATLVQAECTRQGLLQASLDWEHGSDAYPDLPVTILLADDAHVTQNNNELRSPLNSVMGNITAYPTAFHLTAVDTDICNVVQLTLPRQTAKDPATNKTLSEAVALTSVRLQIGLVDKAWEQLEVLNVLPGSYNPFSPQSMPAQPGALWTASQTGATKLSRDQLIAVADRWAAALEAGSAAGAPVGLNCVRHENGVTQPCSNAFASYKYTVFSRRYVVDTQTGVVAGLYSANRRAAANTASQDLLRHDFFKINAQGQVVEVYSAIRDYDGTKADLWKVVENTEQFQPPVVPPKNPVLCDLLHQRCIISGQNARRWVA